ncbi:MAG: polysulfide reductase NrfD [Comamonadaceae bacterium]|nr:polysulfide reductase NrfD [Comamonadaceae bacterium]
MRAPRRRGDGSRPAPRPAPPQATTPSLFGDLNDPEQRDRRSACAEPRHHAVARRPQAQHRRALPGNLTTCACERIPPSSKAAASSTAAGRGLGGLIVAARPAGAAHYMEHHGHIVTGMNNQVVWGTPHVFAIFLIVAASGALNVASIGSVFGKRSYKPRGAAVGPAVAGPAGRRPGGAGARPRPPRPADRGHDVLQLQVDLRLERLPVHRLSSRIVGVYLWTHDGAAHERLFQAGRLRRLHLAPGAHHRYRLHLRLPGGARGLRRRAAGADVHRHVLRLGPGGRSCIVQIGALLAGPIAPLGDILLPHEEPARHLRRRRAVFRRRPTT